MIVSDKNAEFVQRCIYKADILKKHIVASPSVLDLYETDMLKYVSYSKQLFILDPKDFFYLDSIPQYGFLVH